MEEHHIHAFKVNIKHEKKSKFSSIVLKLRGIDQVRETIFKINSFFLDCLSCLIEIGIWFICIKPQ